MKNIITILILLLYGINSRGANVTISMGVLTGMDITPANILDFDVISHYQVDKTFKIQGKLQYRNTQHMVYYSANVVLHPGVNRLSGQSIRLQYSSSDLERLLSSGSKPLGAYEYCVTVTASQQVGEEQVAAITEDCVFGNNDDVFLIELNYPEDDAKIREFNPQLIWLVNSPLVGQLQYRVKVAELKPKQSKLSAIQRNNYVLDYQYNNVNALVYPVSGRPLKVAQPYVWTVDAYYRDILIGTAAPWQFTIVEDSLQEALPLTRAYYDFANSREPVVLNVGDTVKLKYNNLKNNMDLPVSIHLLKNGTEKEVYTDKMKLSVGWNYKDLLLRTSKMRHGKTYLLRFKIDGKQYDIPFKYNNVNRL